MPSDRIPGALRDILHHIDLAAEFAGRLDREEFAADLRTVYAVTRCLEIISEASRRLPEELKARHPAIAWKQMAAAAMSIATIMRTLPPISCGRLFNGLCRLSGRSLKRRLHDYSVSPFWSDIYIARASLPNCRNYRP
ncbi:MULTISPECIES: HepT-like ribonuclease domain-containing protein [unclassified Bradyrhizobium]|uniref:HepT-like ribonuclease domain-containing protein n=1 Tax=unclassified Bradyrhizobium TaxID=2631580 RepID=UPI0031F77571